MAVSDEDGTAERLAQTRAERRHIRRLRTAEHRDAAHERRAERQAGLEAETSYDPPTTPPPSSADSREMVAAGQDVLALERGSLVADREPENGMAMEL